MAVRWKSVKKFDLIDQAVPFLKISFSFAHRQYGGIVRGMGCMNAALHLYVQAQACGAPVLKLLWIGRGRRELFFFMIYTSDASWGRENHSYRFHAAEWSTWSWSRVSKCQLSLNFFFFAAAVGLRQKFRKRWSLFPFWALGYQEEALERYWRWARDSYLVGRGVEFCRKIDDVTNEKTRERHWN